MKIKNLFVFLIAIVGISALGIFAFSQSTQKPNMSPPRLPMNIPPPPNFSSLANKSGKFQLISAEYYSQDDKPYLYKRLVKYDTSTGEAWVLNSKLTISGEKRSWEPLVK